MSKIINAIKWFFRQPEDDRTEVTRKLKGYRDPQTVKMPDPVPAVKEAVDSLVKLSPTDIDAVEAAKKRLFVPLDFNQNVLDYVLRVNGFQKSVVTPNGNEYDPRLIALVNLSINMYYCGVAERLTPISESLAKANEASRS